MENKNNQSGGNSNRNRNNNRNNNNRNRNNNRNGGQRNSNNNNQRSSNNRNGNNSNSNRNRNNNNRNRSRKPKKVELTAVQKFLKVITFGAIDPNKNLHNNSKPKPKQQAQTPAKTKKPAQPMSEQGSKPKPKQKSRTKLREVTSPRLYVGNLDYAAAEDDLEELFRGVGNVLSAEVVTNARTQQSKGFAFVEMGSIEEAKRAVEVLHDEDFMGRKLLVSGARSEGPRKSKENEEAEVA